MDLEARDAGFSSVAGQAGRARPKLSRPSFSSPLTLPGALGPWAVRIRE